MQLGILVTDNGKHSAEKWAVHTASSIIQIAASAAGVQAIEARKLELNVLNILEVRHKEAMDYERAELEKDGIARQAQPCDPEAFADTALAEIVAASQGTRFEEHFKNPETVLHIARVLHEHFAASMTIERQWHPTFKEKA
jgi:hypothetical protein